MLNRLKYVLIRDLKTPSHIAERLIEVIAGYTEAGPAIALGGTGVIALPDAEDAHVLETALAGFADILVTANLKDFKRSRSTRVVLKDQYLVYSQPPKSPIRIVSPQLMWQWVREE